MTHLPFETLGVIFSHYAEEETFQRPLETLLLVCRAWNEAAVGHRTLWNNFKIHLGHGHISYVWSVRVSMRMARCGDNIPLYIELHTIPEGQDLALGNGDDSEYSYVYLDRQSCGYRSITGECRCANIAAECAYQALRVLAGPNGEHCARWRLLKLHLNFVADRKVASALCDRTPNLTYLELHGLRLEKRDLDLVVLPSMSEIKEVVLLDCFFPARHPLPPQCD